MKLSKINETELKNGYVGNCIGLDFTALKINNTEDRRNTLVALANAGYTVKVFEEKSETGFSTDYFIAILDLEKILSQKGELIKNE